MASTGNIMRDDSHVPASSGYDPAGHQNVAIQATGVATDSTTNQQYGALSVSQLGSGSVFATLQNAAVANGNGSILSVLGYGTVVFTISGTFSATVNFECNEDGATWNQLNVAQSNGAFITTSTGSAGNYLGAISGQSQIRARISSYVSGSVTVTAHAIPLAISPPIQNAFLLDKNGSNQASIDSSGNLQIKGTVQPGNTANTTPWLVDEIPLTGTQVHTSASGTNAVVTATLAGIGAKFTYLTGFEITGLPATVLSSGDVTVSGVSGGPWTYEFAESVAGGGMLAVEFSRPVQSSAVNTAITVSCAALGASSAKVSVVAHGFQF